MLPRCFAARIANGPPHWPLRAFAGLLTLAVLGSGVAALAPVRQDDTKKANKTEEPKKSDADKEIDDLVDEMTRNMPPGMEESVAQRMREQMRQNLRTMPPEQRKRMVARMRGQNPFAGVGQAGIPMPPGLGGSRPDGRLGARVEPASATLAEQLDLPKDQGLVVREVVPDSAADKAGLKPHDILLELNGKAVINRADALSRLLADIKADTAVELVVLRKGKKETIKDVKLPEAKEPPAVFPGAPGGFPPAFPQPPAGGFPQPPGVGPLPPFGGNGRAVMTTLLHTPDRFTLRHQEGSLIITLTGTSADGKAKVKSIHVQDGMQNEQYESVDKVPERYQEKVKNLIEMGEKSSSRLEIKSP